MSTVFSYFSVQNRDIFGAFYEKLSFSLNYSVFLRFSQKNFFEKIQHSLSFSDSKRKDIRSAYLFYILLSIHFFIRGRLSSFNSKISVLISSSL